MRKIIDKIQRRLSNKFFINKKGITCGKNVRINRKTHLLCNGGNLHIGNNVTVFEMGHISSIDGGIINLEESVFINRNCCIVSREEVTIGRGCIIGPNVTIYDHNHKFSQAGIAKAEYRTAAVEIGENCWIGAGAIILKGSKIGANSIIGAGVVVDGVIPEKSIIKVSTKDYVVDRIY